MIAGIKTALEARKDAQVWQALKAQPELRRVMMLLQNSPANFPENDLTSFTPLPPDYTDVLMPQIVLDKIKDVWGYEFTTTPAVAPVWFPSPPNPVLTWVKVLTMDWSGMIIGEEREKTLTGNVVNNNAVANTLQDTGLEFTVKNGETYVFEAFIPYTAAATTTGSRWVIDGPSATMSYKSEYTLTATTQTVNILSAYNLPATCNATSLAISNAVIKGSISPTANGVVKIRFASEVAGSAITARTGATLTWRRVL